MTTTGAVPDQARLLPALVAAAGVAAAAWPLQGLFASSHWLPSTALTVGAVALAGVLLRAWARPVGAVVAAQFALAVAVPVWMWCSDSMFAGLVPTTRTPGRVVDLLRQAGEVLATSAPPVPPNPGVALLVCLALGAVAWATDALAVTLRQPALAGLPLLTPYLTAVANSDGELPWTSFVLVAAAWLALLLTCGWGEHARLLGAADPTGRARRHRLVVGTCAALAAGSLALAAGIGVPRLPVRYLADGYGTAGTGRGTVGYSPTSDMLASLRSTDGDPVFTYTTDDPDVAPLRVGVTSRYEGGTWAAPPNDVDVSTSPTLSPARGLVVPRDTPNRTVEVEDNRLAAPYLAAPPVVVQGTVTGARWGMDPRTGTLAVDRTPPTYRMTYLDVDPTAAARTPDAPEPAAGNGPWDPAPPAVAAEAERVTAQASSTLEVAAALQAYFRTGDFTYSLDVVPPPAGMSEQEAADTAVERFLTDRQGYCVQFTTAFVMMARSRGLTARMATGFLPGSRGADGRYTVLPSDAHAWPEVFVDGAGWVRFEPTPGARTGAAPGYSEPSGPATPAPTSAAPTAEPSEPTPSAPTTSSRRERPDVDAGAGSGASEPAGGLLRPAVLVPALVALLLLAAASVLPLAAAAARRRRVREAGDDARDVVEARWEGLLDRLGDLGLRSEAALPLRGQARDLAGAGLFDPEPEAALDRLAATVEAARYLPADPPAWSESDERLVRSAARSSRALRDRLVSTVFPASGRAALLGRVRPRHPTSTS